MFKTAFASGLELEYVGGDLNIEGELRRTERGLHGPQPQPLCNVLMRVFVASVAFQIHANRSPVL